MVKVKTNTLKYISTEFDETVLSNFLFCTAQILDGIKDKKNNTNCTCMIVLCWGFQGTNDP